MSIIIENPVVEMHVKEDDVFPVTFEFREKSGETAQVLMTLSQLVGFEKQLNVSIKELGLDREALLKGIVITVIKKEREEKEP